MGRKKRSMGHEQRQRKENNPRSILRGASILFILRDVRLYPLHYLLLDIRQLIDGARLLFMTYNGWVMLAVTVGAFVGYLAWGGGSATKSVACH